MKWMFVDHDCFLINQMIVSSREHYDIINAALLYTIGLKTFMRYSMIPHKKLDTTWYVLMVEEAPTDLMF